MSIAVSESFLGIALTARLITAAGRRAGFHPPRVFWLWLAWAVLEVIRWLCSPNIPAGTGEIRHLMLIAALFFALPAVPRTTDKLVVWRGVCVAGTISSLVLIVTFLTRLVTLFEVEGISDPVLHLRNGGLVHHWMIYATIEVLLFGGLLELHAFYPKERWWVIPAIGVNCLAIYLSLTRTLWLGCLVVLGLHLSWRRSRWLWLLPALPLLAGLLAPGAVRSRIAQSFHPQYYSNTERLQMWRVGLRMIRERPLTGVGPGRVEELYVRYLSPEEPVPAYHGHLHNNALQLAAQFGLPILGAAVLFLAVLVKDLLRAWRRAPDRENLFLCRSSLLGIAGYLVAGMTEYTYGHSLGLILFSFVALSPLFTERVP